MPALSRLLSRTALVVLAAVAGCDFTPTLDVDTPDFEPGLVLRSILVADSVATVRVGEAWNPYEGRLNRLSDGEETLTGTVTLLRDGQPVETLAIASLECNDYGRPPGPGGEPPTYECGPYVGTVPLEAGATYTVRAEVEGLPAAEGTVTVPLRPEVEVAEENGTDDGRRFRIRLRDPEGLGDRYGLSLLRTVDRFRGTVCDNTGCRDTTYVDPNPGGYYASGFETSDPVVLAATRQIAGGRIDFASVPDDTFDGRTWDLTISTDANARYYESDDLASTYVVQIAAIAQDVYDIYQIDVFSGGDENPFAEPANPPSNVEGGYGLVGALSFAEATFGPSDP